MRWKPQITQTVDLSAASKSPLIFSYFLVEHSSVCSYWAKCFWRKDNFCFSVYVLVEKYAAKNDGLLLFTVLVTIFATLRIIYVKNFDFFSI